MLPYPLVVRLCCMSCMTIQQPLLDILHQHFALAWDYRICATHEWYHASLTHGSISKCTCEYLQTHMCSAIIYLCQRIR